MVSRILKHLLTPAWWYRRAFPRAVMRNIEKAIRDSETHHFGEIRFVVEADLSLFELLRGITARDRAIELFSQLRIWDTEHNSGVLIYLLLADHDVEIIADRGIHHRVGNSAWEGICQKMEQEFRQQRFEAGVIYGINAISELLHQHFPAPRHNVNELSDSAIIL
jgi:uncharacterized membrane protein